MKRRTTAIALAGALTALALPATGSAATGQVTEFPVPSAGGQPFGISAGPDGNVWFTEGGTQKVGRITPSGTVTDYPVTGGVQPRDITVGPDNNLWMTDQGANKVFKIVPDANPANPPTITAGTAPLATPRGIASINGELWIANAGGTVQRVKTDGTADGPAIPTTGTNLQFSTKGSDGSFWSTDFNGGLIKVTTGATPTATAVDIGANKGPLGITSGPDGKVYFSEAGAAPAGERIGRIGTDGTGLQETANLSGGASDPEGLAFGRDGNLYNAIFNGSQIGQITLALGLTQFKNGITAASGPRTIARGPDGNMWFTEETANKIGRFTVDPPSTGGSTTSGGSTSSTGSGSDSGSASGSSATTGDVSNVAAKPSRFRVGAAHTATSAARRTAAKTGTTFAFSLTNDSSVTLRIEQAVAGRKKGARCAAPSRLLRHAKRCARYVRKGTLMRSGKQGANAVAFSGRIGGRALRPGHYRVAVAGSDGVAQYAKFTVLAAKPTHR
jgi:streptogramin lyase